MKLLSLIKNNKFLFLGIIFFIFFFSNQAVFATADITTGLIHYYTLDDTDGTTAIDTEGDNASGTYTAGTGLIGGGITLNGSSDIITPTTPITFSSAGSVSIWFKTVHIGWGYVSGNLAGVSGVNVGYYLWNWDNNFYVGDGGGNQYSWYLGDPSDAFWHNVTISWDGSATVLYYDGVNMGTNYMGGLCPIENFGAGGAPNGPYYWNGMMDDIRVYNRALTEEDALAIWNGGAGVGGSSGPADITTGLIAQYNMDDNTASTTVTDVLGNNPGTAQRNTSVIHADSGNTPNLNGSLSFNGSSDYIDLGDNFGFTSGSFSVSFWLKTTDSGFHPIFAKDDVNQRGYVFGIHENVLYIELAGTSQIFGSTALNNGEWHLATYVFDGSNYTMYLDAVSDGTSANSNPPANSSLTSIGRRNYTNSEGYYTGDIDDVRVYERALSATDVESLYNDGVGVPGPATTCDATCVALRSDLKAYLPLDSDTDDYSDIGTNDGISSGATPTDDGIVGNSYTFNGSDNSISIDNLANFDFSNNDFTVNFWAKPDASSNGQAVAVTNANTGSFASFMFNYDGPNSQWYLMMEGSDCTCSWSCWKGALGASRGTATVGEWQQITATRNGGSMDFYVNGVSTGGWNNPSGICQTNLPVVMGKMGAYEGPYYFPGELDELGVWDRALTSDEVEDLYYSSGGRSLKSDGVIPEPEPEVVDLGDGLVSHYLMNDNTTSTVVADNIGTNTGTAQRNTSVIHTDSGNPPTLNGALTFNGSSDMVVIPDSADMHFGTGDWSMSAWVKSTNTSKGESEIFAKSNTNTSLGPINFSLNPGGHLYLYMSASGSGWDFYDVESGSNLSQDTWYWLLLQREGTAVNVYVNGVLDFSINVGASSLDWDNGQDLQIGHLAYHPDGNNRYFPGYIDDVRIYNRALNSTEIDALYNDGEGTEEESPTGCQATGGTITEVDGYKIHTFISDGTFTVSSESCDVEVLVVAGGGAGGTWAGGGGGAGGVISSTTYAVTAQAYPITVGAGAPRNSSNSKGGNGENSVFDTLTAIGGGGGGRYGDWNGSAGGSGGGGGYESCSGGSGTEGQGHDGGGCSTPGGSGGGGGAGEAGATHVGSVGGAGGAGLQFPQFASVGGDPAGWFGGGGGGWGSGETGSDYGLGGAGGGGVGDNNTNVISQHAGDGVANTGGGGGGGWYHDYNEDGGAGGSGIVIIRYSTTGGVAGCMDPLANNYNELATVDDESCTYSILAVTKSGTQIATTTATSTDQNLGGAFSLLSGGDLTVDSIKIKQIGSFPNSDIENIRLYYKQENTCSATRPSGTTEFDTIATLDENGQATSTGSLSLTAGSTTCLYFVYDLTGTSGISNMGRSIDFEITNPSTDVVVTGGTVGTTAKVNISGTTMIIDSNTDSSSSDYIKSLFSLNMRDEAKNPTIFYLQNNVVYKKEGNGNPIRLTNPNLQVHNLTFTDMQGGYYRIEITISNMDPGQEGTFMNVTRTLRTTAGVRAWNAND